MDCEDEEPLAAMARTDFFRAEESCLNLETQPVKVSPDPFKPAGCDHAGHIFDERAPRAGLDEDAPEGRPEIAFVLAPKPLSGDRVRLAWDSANDAIHAAAKLSAWEGSGIAPQRRRSQKTLLHRRDQMSACEGFPLHVSDRAIAWNCQFDAEIKPAASGADGDCIERPEPARGMYSHIHTRLPRLSMNLRIASVGHSTMPPLA